MDNTLLDNLKKYCDGNKLGLEFVNNQVTEALQSGKKLNMGKIEHIIDFIVNSPFPPEQHSIRSLEKRAKKWIELNQELATGIVLTDSDVEIVFEKNNLYVYKLLSKNAVIHEGKVMNHCVGGYDPTRTDLYSLRDENGHSKATIEVTDNDINQIKGRGNGYIKPDYVDTILDFLELIGKPIRPSEMQYLGYLHIKKNSEAHRTLVENTNASFIERNGDLFLCVNKEIKVKNGKK